MASAAIASPIDGASLVCRHGAECATYFAVFKPHRSPARKVAVVSVRQGAVVAQGGWVHSSPEISVGKWQRQTFNLGVVGFKAQALGCCVLLTGWMIRNPRSFAWHLGGW